AGTGIVHPVQAVAQQEPAPRPEGQFRQTARRISAQTTGLLKPHHSRAEIIMLSLTETDSGFSSLSRLYKEQASNLFAEVTLQGEVLSLPPCDNAFHYGMDASRIYLVK